MKGLYHQDETTQLEETYLDDDSQFLHSEVLSANARHLEWDLL